jgi:branched-subunit amino acid aminotransferase/4-amino-4-deoxychorismate lyase
MRESIIHSLQSSGESIIEKEIHESELWEADEIFLTNSITPMKWVAAINNKSYGNAKIKELFHRLFQTKREFFC